ncbi:rab effector MyRIP isoform X6 [Chiroxiphia lanceolata]|uniref:rab effector MyRIP isoform X6 n=1 Tax=Chiroxiphia lanceolata TaxID=296741 RepID=UPI0013CE412E|nr:rab effector MyRIP isoform X6 [Chiroxiphia lanceolata]
MGRKLDLSGLTDEEAEHVLQVVQRDFSLRKKEEERLSEMKQKLDEEGNKCSILSKQQKFNEHCCIRCCSPFTFLINSKRQCQDCKYNICKNCSTYQKKEKAWICSVCQQARLLRTQSLDWYYNNVKSRFKCFGSAKVLKNLYKKHRLESGVCPDTIAEGSLFEGSIENEGSICGSDSTFYQQTEGHSMMDTLAVALRVAEEAVEEAISKAETYSDSLDKQNEACYLQEHKEDLIEELATTIVQKIIKKQKSKAEQAEADFEWPPSRSSGLASVAVSDQSMLTFPGSRRGSYTLWRSQSAFSLASEDTTSKGQDSASTVPEALQRQKKGQSKKQKEHKLSTLPSWKSVDRLNETSPPSVLQSTDGNWVALQNVALPRPRMLAKPKSQDFDDLSETDISNEDQHHNIKPDLMEEELKSRLFQLAAKMSDKETSSGEEQESEPGMDPENQKESLSSEENGRSIQEELKKFTGKIFPQEFQAPETCGKAWSSEDLSWVDEDQKYSAVSLCNISTEVLKVINATEELIAESTDPCDFPDDIQDRGRGTLPLGTDPVRLDEQLTTLEENVYLTASTVYGLEGQLTNLEDAARKINSVTEESELADLEDQVATAAAQVHHAELQISDIESRISALTVAGLNVAPCVRLTRKRDQKQTNQMHTIDTSRQQRRKLPAPPIKGETIDGSPVTTVRTFNRNFMLQGSLTQRTKERKSTAKDLMEPAIGSAVMY